VLSPNGIRAIFFDLDGTLRFNRPSGREYFMDYAEVLGVPTTREQRALVWRWEHFYWADSSDMQKDEALYPDRGSFWLNYSQRQLIAMGCPIEQARQLAPVIHQHMNENYKPENWVDPSTKDLLKALKAAGFTLGVISNRDEPFSGELTTLGLGEFFEFSISGGEAGSKKPGTGIFNYTLAKAGAAPHETMYVGDNYFADVVGARNANLHPVLLDTDGIFHQPGCPTIKSLTELPDILKHTP